MAVVFSEGALQAVRAVTAGGLPPTTHSGATITAGDPTWLHADYAGIYRAHPFIRTCVDFLSRGIAQLGLHLYQRQDDGGRERLREHPVQALLDAPNGWTSRYDHQLGTIADLGIYGVAYWLKLGPRGARRGLMRLEPPNVEVIGASVIGPRGYDALIDGTRVPLDPADVIRFRWWDPDPTRAGLPPIESLRRIVAEDRAAAAHRTALWAGGARIGGVIERPKEAGLWSPEARQRLRAQWTEQYSGPASVGQVPILEDGMVFKPVTMSLADTQADAMRAANAEDIARVFQIPAPMVGLLTHATYSNVKEQHKHLYQDCFGPICSQLEDTLTLALLSEYDAGDAYLEFNIAEKLKGSFDEQARGLQILTGGQAVITVNEARALLNRPALPGGDTLMAPLNMTVAATAPPPPAEDSDHAPRGVVH